MSVLEKFSKKITETAKAAAKKSGDIVEVTKLNMSINTEEDKVQKLYEEIGRIVYNYFKSQENVPEELKEVCAEIQRSENIIKNYKKRILELKSLKLCDYCGAELEGDENFCPYCGARQKTSNGKDKKNNAENVKADKEEKIDYDVPDDEDETSSTSDDMMKSSKSSNGEDSSSSFDDKD